MTPDRALPLLPPPRAGSAGLAILLDAMSAVVGEVSKAYQAVRRAVETGDPAIYGAAMRAFDGLPVWQRERILRVATARAEERARTSRH